MCRCVFVKVCQLVVVCVLQSDGVCTCVFVKVCE